MHVKNNCYHSTQELLALVVKGNASHNWEILIQLFCKFYFVKQLCFLLNTREFEGFDVRPLSLGIYMDENLGSVCAKLTNSERTRILSIYC